MLWQEKEIETETDGNREVDKVGSALVQTDDKIKINIGNSGRQVEGKNISKSAKKWRTEEGKSGWESKWRVMGRIYKNKNL